MTELRVVGLGGSLKETSNSLMALEFALRAAEEAGASVELLDIRALDLPMYSPEDDVPPQARHMADTIYNAHGLIWSSPLYHGSVSGSFKNAIDWLQLLSDRDPPYLTDKIIGLISTAGGTQGLQAVNTMEFIVRSLRAYAVPLVLPVSKAWQVFDEDGQVADAAIAGQLQTLGREVVRAARQFSDEGFNDYSRPYPAQKSSR